MALVDKDRMKAALAEAKVANRPGGIMQPKFNLGKVKAKVEGPSIFSFDYWSEEKSPLLDEWKKMNPKEQAYTQDPGLTFANLPPFKPMEDSFPRTSVGFPKDEPKAITTFAPEDDNLVGRFDGQLGYVDTDTSAAVADAIIAAPVAVERNGLMSRPASDAAPTADTTSAAPEVSTSQAGPWLTGVLDTILVAEGGYQTLPKDKGNYRPDGTLVGTNRGITSQALATYKGVNANTITAEDIKAVTEQDARDIYINNYYLKPKLDTLPDNIRASVFDMNINAGSNSIKILQRLAGLTGEEVDGGMGPNTLKAIEKAAITPDQYADARIKYYKEVVKKDPEKEEFLDGWITRANKYRE